MTLALVILFGVMVAAAVVLSLALVNRLAVVRDVRAGRFDDLLQRVNDADDFAAAAGAVYGLTIVVIVVVFIIWMFRAAKNNEALERLGARFGPGWSIGSWFIPFANLVIPVLIVQDLWRGARPETPRGDPAWRRAAGSWLVGLWWAAWLLSLVRFGAGSPALDDRASLDEIERSNTLALVGAVATAVAAVLATFVVWSLARRQLDTLRTQRAVYEREVYDRETSGPSRSG
jgi:hypothetical protein